jgi:AbrB family looped-hinge helix DNA binding protein
MEAKIDDDGRIVIPKMVREKLGIGSGSSLKIRVDPEGEIGEAVTSRQARRLIVENIAEAAE